MSIGFASQQTRQSTRNILVVGLGAIFAHWYQVWPKTLNILGNQIADERTIQLALLWLLVGLLVSHWINIKSDEHTNAWIVYSNAMQQAVTEALPRAGEAINAEQGTYRQYQESLQNADLFERRTMSLWLHFPFVVGGLAILVLAITVHKT